VSDASEILRAAALEVGWEPPEGDEDAIARWCLAQLRVIAGGQDRDHAANAVRSALDAARAGNAEYATAGLRIARDATLPHAH